MLITGSAGFVGSDVVRHRYAVAPGDTIVVDALAYAGNRAGLDGAERIVFVSGDSNDDPSFSEKTRCRPNSLIEWPAGARDGHARAGAHAAATG